MIFGKEYYRDLIAKAGLPEMPITKVNLNTNLQINKQSFYTNLIKLSKKFVQFIAFNNITDLFKLNQSFENIELMKNKIIPENLSIYIRIPPNYDGKLEFTNLFLIPTYPFKQILDNFITEQIIIYNKQTRNKTINYPTELYIPNPTDMVFIPALKGFTSPGGNTSTDKMSEIGSTMFLKNDGRF